MLVLIIVDLIKCHCLFFNCKSFCSFIEYLLLQVNGFLKMIFSLTEHSRIVFPGIFLGAYSTFYVLRHPLFILFLILLFSKIKQAKETRMSYNSNENTFFFLNQHLGGTRFNTEWFLSCQLSYFALANIRLHRYDSFFRFILLLLGDIKVNPGPTSVTNNIIPLDTLPFHNCGIIAVNL